MSSRPLKASGLLQARAGATTERKTPEITTDEELERAVSRMRDAGTDIAEYEMKEARGYPSNVVDSLCAFANTTGGVVILGVSEKDFQPVDIDVKKLQARLASSARNEIEPAIHIDIKVLYLAGKPVVVANVPPVDAVQKPCYVKKYGLERGAFIRTGDGDYRMSAYEIHRFQENEQLCSGHDCAIVSRATIGDLNDRLVKRWVGAVTGVGTVTSGRAGDDDGTVAGGGTADGSGDSGDVQAVAQRYGVLVADKKGELHPSLAGLLVFWQATATIHAAASPRSARSCSCKCRRRDFGECTGRRPGQRYQPSQPRSNRLQRLNPRDHEGCHASGNRKTALLCQHAVASSSGNIALFPVERCARSAD